MLGALADGTGFSPGDLLGLDAPDLVFWWNIIMTWRTQIQQK
jgi:hypothetical protein